MARMRRAILIAFFLLPLVVSARPARAGLLDATDDEDLDATVLSCEEAAAALDECCPDFNPQWVSCVEATTACGAHHTPELSLQQSRCIREASCEDLRRSHACENIGLRRSRVDEGPVPPFEGACR